MQNVPLQDNIPPNAKTNLRASTIHKLSAIISYGDWDCLHL